MTTFNLSIDSRPVMLLEIAKHVSDRSLAFAVLDAVDDLAWVIVAPTIDSQPQVEINIWGTWVRANTLTPTETAMTYEPESGLYSAL